LDKKIRLQLTLFVDKKDTQEIEGVRRQFNPKQQELIDSHVTLCREDEIENIDALLDNLQQLNTPKISINFGQVTRFENDLGVMLPASGNNDQFHLLRSKVLAGISATVRRPEPHITLMHPRNSTCTNEIFSVIQQVRFPTHLIFDKICLIEQINGGQWHIIKCYKLSDS
jgi:2'-5' RNA ligase superfamily